MLQRVPHLDEQGGRKVTIGEECMCAPVTAPQGQEQSCCRSEPVAHMKSEDVPSSFLELPKGRENHIYNWFNM